MSSKVYTDTCPTCDGAGELTLRQQAATVAELLDARGLLDHVKAVVKEHHVLLDEVLGRARTAQVAAARRECWIHMKELGFSYPEIGRIWNRDHSTVMHAIKDCLE